MKNNTDTEKQGFGKRVDCPTAEVILSYTQGNVVAADTPAIRAHLVSCDYCRAESLFLANFPPTEECKSSASEMPFALRQLAESLLKNPKKQSSDLSQMLFTEEKPFSSNFQMQ